MFLDSPPISGSSVICAGEKYLPRDEEGELFPTAVFVPSLHCGQGLEGIELLVVLCYSFISVTPLEPMSM